MAFLERRPARGTPTFPAEFCDALLAPQPFEHDPDLLFRGGPPSGPPADLSHCRFARLFLLLRHIETLLGVLRTPDMSLGLGAVGVRILLTGYSRRPQPARVRERLYR
ncbi:MAG: hypothetical protein CL933_07330 [Deltaproteobacteria bacterium]|nr:hypothetical protein [Deltaproteobacteria bacterium]